MSAPQVAPKPEARPIGDPEDAYAYRRVEACGDAVRFPELENWLLIRLEAPGTYSDPGCVRLEFQSRWMGSSAGGRPRELEKVSVDLYDRELDAFVSMLASVVAKARLEGIVP